MGAQALVPLSSRLHLVRARRRPGPPALHLRGVPGSVGDRVRASVLNTGYALPTGCIDIEVDPPPPTPAGVDLALALVLLLADPAHEHVRSPGLVAWGRLALDGNVLPAGQPPIDDLPPGAWIGRFWQPDDRIPAPEDDAVISIVDVADLRTAWRSLLGFLEIERALRAVGDP